MDARTKEAIRYLGYGRHAVDDHTLKLVESCFEELSQAACGRIVYRIFELEFPESGRILLGNLDIHSKNLYKNLTGCKKAVLLGATLGPKVDLLLRKYSIGDMARVVTLQACAAAMLEEYLDEWQTALEADRSKRVIISDRDSVRVMGTLLCHIGYGPSDAWFRKGESA